MNWQDNDITVLAAELPGRSIAWLKDLRAQQWAQFLHNGLPTRTNEAWKYSDISSLAQQFAHCERSAPNQKTPKEEQHNTQTTAAIQLNFVNSQMTMLATELPAGVVVTDLSSALSTHPELVKRALSEHQSSAEGMINFNTSLWQNGVFIFVPDEVVVDKPLIIHYHAVATAPNMLVLRNLVFLGKNSQLTLIQHFSGENETPYWQHSVTQIDLAERAKLTHVKCQNEGRQATHLSEHLIQQASQSIVHSSSFALGAKLTREAWQVNLSGSQSHCECRGLSIVNQAQHSDYHVTMNHAAPACVSEQIFKAIASDKSRAIFNGKVIVHPTGQQAIAHQHSQNLLLSSLAEIDTRPELEIYADDVKCSHGASVGQLDPEALFYLQSRGIAHDQASEMLLQAFVQDQLTDVLPEIQALIAPILNAKLAEINGVQCQ